MAMDLSRIPKKEGINNIILITSDTDFVPVIKDLREDKINVTLAYFTDRKRKSAFQARPAFLNLQVSPICRCVSFWIVPRIFT